MSAWVWWVIGGLIASKLLCVVAFLALHWFYRIRYLDQIIRIFEEKPLFIVPKGQPLPDAEDVLVPTPEGLNLRGCYLKAMGPRKGVILFGLEFGSNRWAAVQYCGKLREAGYDIFAVEPRSQGESDKDPNYTPLQWVTDKDRTDIQAAVAYLKSRPDAPEEGIGLFGVSKGASVGLLVASKDPWIKCVATDGAYGTYTTMVPYMQRWVNIYVPRNPIRNFMPGWFYGLLGLVAIRKVSERRKVRYLSVERAIKRARQPLFMIHGGGDKYILPQMAKTLYKRASASIKSLWLVPGAKHNQALHVAGDEYHRQLAAFFDQHLAGLPPESAIVVPAGEGSNLLTAT